MLRNILILILALFFHSMDVTVVSAKLVFQNTKPNPPKAPTKSIPAPKKQITPKKKTTLRNKIESLERADSIKKAQRMIDSIKVADSLQIIDSVKKHVSAKLQTDSVQAFLTDSSRITDTLSKRSKSDLDTVVTYYARDTVMFSLSKKSMRLRGQSRAIFKEQKLEAEVIEFDFNASTMQANAAADSSGRFSGYPKFTDRGEEFVGEKLLFNFQTKRGTITLGETKVQDGFYFGSKVKRVNENTLFIQNGCYTTCSQPHPHFYFGSPEMKVITNDRIFINPLVVYVEDMPVFALPFGLYFENKTGRRSGIIIPSFFFSNLNGVTFQNLGYYFALSDYYDTQFSADIFSKTGYLLRNSTRYVYQKSLNGNFSLSFGRRSSSSDAELLNNWKIDFSHSQILTPQANLTANLSFSSQDFNRNFSTDLNQRIQQEISSYASIFQSFDNGTSLSGGFTRSQNIITGAYQTGGNASFSVPQIFPFKKLTQSDNWLGDIALTYSGRAGYTLAKAISKTDLDTVTNINTYTFSKNESYAINHNPSISISPKLGYFSITPSISYRENWFFRKRTKTINPIDSTVIDTYEHSVLPYRDYFYDFGLSVGTRIYGVFQPNLFGIKAMRHVFIPNVRFNYTPEYSARTTDKIGQYTDLMSGDVIQYSHFDKDGGEGVRPEHDKH
ncbi:MAG: hypothetical protein IPM69_00815 [Ignavibacteria bacterium]|nr:hypothetical protein [Ignavibacteria bacterium]